MDGEHEGLQSMLLSGFALSSCGWYFVGSESTCQWRRNELACHHVSSELERLADFLPFEKRPANNLVFGCFRQKP